MQQAKYLVQLAIIVMISLYDLKERRAPDPLTLGGLCLMLVFAGAEGLGAFLAAASGGVLAFLVLSIARLATREGLGLGDVKFGAFLGAGLGARAVLVCFFAAAVLALGYAGLAALRGRFSRGTRLPFAPFLGAGAILAMALPLFGLTLGA